MSKGVQYKTNLIRRVAGNDLYIRKVRIIYNRIMETMINDLFEGKTVNFFEICNLQIVNDNRKHFFDPKSRKKIIRKTHKRLRVRAGLRFRRTINNYKTVILDNRQEKEVKNV